MSWREKSGIPVIVMEPVKGGTLASLPEDIAGMFAKADRNRSCASWAMRWVASHPGVKVILSGMSTPEQVEDNLATLGRFEPLSRLSARWWSRWPPRSQADEQRLHRLPLLRALSLWGGYPV